MKSEQTLGGTRLVIGANRGIGLALVRAQLARPEVTRLVATHRAGSNLDELRELEAQWPGKLLTASLEVTDPRDLAELGRLAREFDGGFDLVIHAAGILHEGEMGPEKSLARCEPDQLMRLFEVNSVAPLMTARALLPAQPRKKRFVFAALSAMVGSIGDNRLGGWYGYRASKAALNQFMRTLSNECRVSHPQAAVVALHPGTTDTALTRPFQRNIDPQRLYTPEQTAERLLSVIDGLKPADSGRFYNWDGSEIPW
jgi:NAD(P)-dependent dehydrogenase (short-subunit alcohol dehydrogenase family)